jgi:hypothetical protein
VRKKFASLALLFAWLCANGALLDVAQLLAWSKMFAGYSGTMSVAAALQKTFDPAKKCRLCLGVARAREAAQQQLPQAVERSAEKLLLAVHSPSPVILIPSAGDWPATPARVAPHRTEPVPVPPPRV